MHPHHPMCRRSRSFDEIVRRQGPSTERVRYPRSPTFVCEESAARRNVAANSTEPCILPPLSSQCPLRSSFKKFAYSASPKKFLSNVAFRRNAVAIQYCPFPENTQTGLLFGAVRTLIDRKNFRQWHVLDASPRGLAADVSSVGQSSRYRCCPSCNPLF